jgi:hypothetical protein
MRAGHLIFIAVVLFPLLAFGQTLKSDREIDGYKGAVKKVVTERADLTMRKGSYVELNRRLEEDIEYDVAGHRARQLSYDYASGLLREIAVYKRIDGDKVVVFEEGETPGAITAERPGSKEEKKWDPRYAYKFKYKADAYGRVLEEEWWQSNGEKWLRYVYSYSGNRKTESVFDAKGKINQKFVHTLDPNGNVSELVIFDVDADKPSEKILYSYLSFDSVGNWTKRSETAGDVDTNFVQKPREVTYRKISYYGGTRNR